MRRIGHEIQPGAVLTGINFTGDDLSGANLREAHISSCDFSYANLRGVNLSSATIENCDLWQTRLANAHFVKTSLTNCNLRPAFMNDRRDRLETIDFAEASFVRCNLESCFFTESNFSSATMDSCRMEFAQFDNCQMTNLLVLDARIAGGSRSVIASGCNFAGSRFVSRKKSSSAKFASFHLEGCDLSNCQFEGADFVLKSCNTAGLALRHVEIRAWVGWSITTDPAHSTSTKDLGLRGPRPLSMEYVSNRSGDRNVFVRGGPQGSRISDVNWNGAVLKHADFSGLSLERVELVGSKLIGCVFDRCHLQDINLEGAVLVDCEFATSWMKRCNYTNAEIVRGSLPPAHRMS